MIDVVGWPKAEHFNFTSKFYFFFFEEKHVLSEVARTLSDGCKLDAILCVAGGWAGGNAANEVLSSRLPDNFMKTSRRHCS